MKNIRIGGVEVQVSEEVYSKLTEVVGEEQAEEKVTVSAEYSPKEESSPTSEEMFRDLLDTLENISCEDVCDECCEGNCNEYESYEDGDELSEDPNNFLHEIVNSHTIVEREGLDKEVVYIVMPGAKKDSIQITETGFEVIIEYVVSDGIQEVTGKASIGREGDLPLGKVNRDLIGYTNGILTIPIDRGIEESVTYKLA